MNRQFVFPNFDLKFDVEKQIIEGRLLYYSYCDFLSKIFSEDVEIDTKQYLLEPVVLGDYKYDLIIGKVVKLKKDSLGIYCVSVIRDIEVFKNIYFDRYRQFNYSISIDDGTESKDKFIISKATLHSISI